MARSAPAAGSVRGRWACACLHRPPVRCRRRAHGTKAALVAEAACGLRGAARRGASAGCGAHRRSAWVVLDSVTHSARMAPSTRALTARCRRSMPAGMLTNTRQQPALGGLVGMIVTSEAPTLRSVATLHWTPLTGLHTPCTGRRHRARKQGAAQRCAPPAGPATRHAPGNPNTAGAAMSAASTVMCRLCNQTMRSEDSTAARRL